MLLGAYPNAKATASTSQVYEAMLADLDVAEARAAVQRLIATSRFMPTVAEIREATAELVTKRLAAAAREREAKRPSLRAEQLRQRDERRLLKRGGE